jgi:uncharacterized protein YhhL (DUF1145 family)
MYCMGRAYYNTCRWPFEAETCLRLIENKKWMCYINGQKNKYSLFNMYRKVWTVKPLTIQFSRTFSDDDLNVLVVLIIATLDCTDNMHRAVFFLLSKHRAMGNVQKVDKCSILLFPVLSLEGIGKKDCLRHQRMWRTGWREISNTRLHLSLLLL